MPISLKKTNPIASYLGRINKHAIVTAVPILLCNGVAVTGQYQFAHSHLPSWQLPGQLMYAAALESIAIYLAYMGHLAQIANDSALRLRLASYSYGLVIGAINYSHYARFSKPTVTGLAVGLMSTSSPWLWAIYTRRTSRDQLATRGLVESHAVRLGSTRWSWHPVRSAITFWLASWTGQANPKCALEDYEKWRAQRTKQDKQETIEEVTQRTGDVEVEEIEPDSADLVPAAKQTSDGYLVHESWMRSNNTR